MSIQVLNIFSFIRARVREISSGDSYKDKLNLLAYAVFRFLPKSLRDKINIMSKLTSHLITSTTLRYGYGKLKVAALDEESLNMCAYGYERWIWRYLKPKQGDVFLDVGAHIGLHTMVAAYKVGDEGLVIAIEPAPANYLFLLKNIKLNNLNNVIPLNVAAWSSNCTLSLNLSKYSGWHSIVFASHVQEKIKVRAVKLDDILLPRLRRLDWIKIDVEGAEIECLKGLRKSILKWRPKIAIEVCENNVSRLKSLLEELNYESHIIRKLSSYIRVYEFFLFPR